MKHLRKYNENNNLNGLDKEYLDECFIDFIDNGAFVESDEDENGRYYEIFINLPGVKNNDGNFEFEIGNTLKDRLEYSRNLTEFYEDIENCIERVKNKYKNIVYDFEIEHEYNSSNSIEGKIETMVESSVHILFHPLKNIIKKPIGTGK